MVSRLHPFEAPARVTPENHPENAPEPAREKNPAAGLGSSISLGILCSVVGAIFGAAALSTSFQSENRWEALTLVPLVGTLVSIIGAWLGAFFHMVRSDSSKAD